MVKRGFLVSSPFILKGGYLINLSWKSGDTFKAIKQIIKFPGADPLGSHCFLKSDNSPFFTGMILFFFPPKKTEPHGKNPPDVSPGKKKTTCLLIRPFLGCHSIRSLPPGEFSGTKSRTLLSPFFSA